MDKSCSQSSVITATISGLLSHGVFLPKLYEAFSTTPASVLLISYVPFTTDKNCSQLTNATCDDCIKEGVSIDCHTMAGNAVIIAQFQVHLTGKKKKLLVC